MPYKVKLEIFEGPFDLLVYLIEREKMNIYDIPIAHITKQYMSYMKQLDQVEVESGAQFLVLAATLIEIKSKMLLPQKNEVREDVPEDPRKSLTQRLLIYKRFKEAAERLGEMEEKTLGRLYKPGEDLSVYEREKTKESFFIDPQGFLRVFSEILERDRKIQEVHRAYGGKPAEERRQVSIREKMQQIRRLLKKSGQISFELVARDCRDRYDVAACFVALLEMARKGQIALFQRERFGEIQIRPWDKKEGEG